MLVPELFFGSSFSVWPREYSSSSWASQEHKCLLIHKLIGNFVETSIIVIIRKGLQSSEPALRFNFHKHLHRSQQVPISSSFTALWPISVLEGLLTVGWQQRLDGLSLFV